MKGAKGGNVGETTKENKRNGEVVQHIKGRHQWLHQLVAATPLHSAALCKVYGNFQCSGKLIMFAASNKRNMHCYSTSGRSCSHD